jgi:hypothetical protein
MPRKRRRKLLSAALAFYSIVISGFPLRGPPSHQNNDVRNEENIDILHPMR